MFAPYFNTDTYQTPSESQRWLGDRMAFGSRGYFVASYLKIVYGAYRLARNNQYDAHAWAESSMKVFRLIEGCGGKIHLEGLHQLRDLDEPVIFVSNHMSGLEANVLPGLIAPHRKVSFVVKESLLSYPLFGQILAASNPIPLTRRSPREDFQRLMSEGAERLSQGTSLVIFPQSTRVSTFDPEAFNSIGAKLAKKAAVRMVPISVKTDFWGNGRYLRDFGPLYRHRPIYISFGKPIEVGKNSRLAHREAIAFIGGKLDSWQSVAVAS